MLTAIFLFQSLTITKNFYHSDAVQRVVRGSLEQKVSQNILGERPPSPPCHRGRPTVFRTLDRQMGQVQSLFNFWGL